jgi:hypothetical protein
MPLLFITRETVAVETPASDAIFLTLIDGLRRNTGDRGERWLVTDACSLC